MILTLLLSSLIGVALGLLGGGGSILAVPVLAYGVGLDAKPAIATALLVVGMTSTVALLGPAKKGLLDVRTGLVFGVSGMVTAFVGGRLAALLPGSLLLAGLALLMLATAFAMLRGRSVAPEPRGADDARFQFTRAVWHGSLVGLVTGLVGAGGGFLIVPALVLLGGMSMRKAVATSLLVIALKSFAGFAGYLGHVAIDWSLAAQVAAAAVAGSFLGGWLSTRVDETRMRRTFAWFLVVMAVFVVSRELPEGVAKSAPFQFLFVERWPFWFGGLALGALVLLMLWLENKHLGVSTGCAELSTLGSRRGGTSWRLTFLGGILLGGILAGLLAGRRPSFALGSFDALVGENALVKVAVLLGAGVLIGYGARVAGGCTSGHGIVGTALGAKSSWVATTLFLLSGFAATFALSWLTGSGVISRIQP